CGPYAHRLAEAQWQVVSRTGRKLAGSGAEIEGITPNQLHLIRDFEEPAPWLVRTKGANRSCSTTCRASGRSILSNTELIRFWIMGYGQNKTHETNQTYETNLRFYSRRPCCSRPVRGACARRAGGSERFRSGRHDSLRSDSPATLGHHGR